MVSKVKLFLLFLLRGGLRIVAQVLSLLGYSSKTFGPPRGYYNSVDELIQLKVDKSNIIFKNILSPVTIGEPFNFDRIKKHNIEKVYSFEKSEMRLNKLDKGRYHLEPHAVMSSDDKLIFSESCCYGMNPKEHWIFHQTRLSKCKILSGSAFMLGGRANYWHLLSEELPSIYRLRKNGLDINNFNHLIVKSSKYDFQNEIYDLFKVPRNKFVKLENYPHIQADSLIYYSPTYQPDLEALAWTRDFILNSTNHKGDTKKRIYICRQNSNSKRIKNNEELLAVLTANNFTVIQPEKMTVLEQVKTFRNADFVIGAHGAALANLMFCNADTNVIEIRSKFHHGAFSAPNVYMWYKELNQLKYSILLSDIEESGELKGRSKMDSDFIIDTNELETLVKLHLNES